MYKLSLLLALTFIIFSNLNIFSQEPSSQKQNRILPWEDALDRLKINGEIGTYAEVMDYRRSVLDDYKWWTAYLQLGLETDIFAFRQNRFTVGVELLAHGQVYNSNEHMYEVDIENGARRSLSQCYIQWVDPSIGKVKAGRIDTTWEGKKVAHLDDNRYEGIFGSFLLPFPNMRLDAGLISAFAELDYDDAEEFTRVTRFNGGDASRFVEVAELVWELPVSPVSVRLNPYFYHHFDYATVFGGNANANMNLTSTLKVGMILDEQKIDSKVGGIRDAENYHLALTGSLNLLKDNKISAQLGHVNMDGKDGRVYMIRPEWFEDYMVPIDQTQIPYQQNASTYYGIVKYTTSLQGQECWASLAYVKTRYNIDDFVRDWELQLGYQISPRTYANLRLFRLDYNNDPLDAKRMEILINCKF